MVSVLPKQKWAIWNVTAICFIVLLTLVAHLERMPERYVPLRHYVIPSHQIPIVLKSDARSAEYCNLPLAPTDGEEGWRDFFFYQFYEESTELWVNAVLTGELVSAEYLLETVHVILRHGDHDIIHNIKKDANPKLHCNMDDQLVQSHPDLSAYVRAMKQYNKSDMYPTRFLCNGSYLTGMGALQALRFGDHLRHKYMSRGKQWNLVKLSDKDVIIRTTTSLRTYQSAIAFFYSFIPHLNLAEIRYNRKLTRRTSKLQHGCTKLIRLYRNEYLQFSVEHHKRDDDFQKALKHLVAVYGKGIQHPWPYLDEQMVLMCHNIPKYCNSKGNCVNNEDIRLLWNNLDNANFIRENKNRSWQKYRTLAGLDILTDIAGRVGNHPTTHDHRAINRTGAAHRPVFVMYSGHGDTVVDVLETLQVYSHKWPPYASRLVIESYVHKKSKRRHFKFIYNGKDITDNIPFCRKKSPIHDTVRLCSGKAFIKFVYHNAYRLFKSSSYKICQNLYKSV